MVLEFEGPLAHPASGSFFVLRISVFVGCYMRRRPVLVIIAATGVVLCLWLLLNSFVQRLEPSSESAERDTSPESGVASDRADQEAAGRVKTESIASDVAVLEVEVLGWSNSRSVKVACFPAGSRAVPLWVENLVVGMPRRWDIKSDMHLDICTVRGQGVPYLERAITLAQGQVSRVVFDMNAVTQTRIIVEGLPRGVFAGAYIALEFYGGESSPGSHVELPLSQKGVAVLGGRGGHLLKASLINVGNIDLVSRDGDAVMRVPPGDLVLRPGRDVIAIAGRKMGEIARPAAVHCGDDWVVAPSGICLIEREGGVRQGVLYSLDGWYADIDFESCVAGAINYVDIEEPRGSLEVALEGLYPEGSTVLALGPHAGEVSASYWNKADPRFRIGKVEGGKAKFLGLPKGEYSVRVSFPGQGRSPVVGRVQIDRGEHEYVLVRESQTDSVIARIGGVEEILQALSLSASDIHVEFERCVMSPEESTDDDGLVWSGRIWGGVSAGVLNVRHPHVLTELDVVVKSRRGGSVQLQVVHNWRVMRMSAVGSDDGSMAVSSSYTQGLEAVLGGDEASFVVRYDGILRMRLWKFVGGRRVFHGWSYIGPEEDRVVLDATGRWVAVDWVGQWGPMRVSAERGNVEEDLGWVAPGADIDAERVWFTDYMGDLVLRDMVGRERRYSGEDCKGGRVKVQ